MTILILFFSFPLSSFLLFILDVIFSGEQVLGFKVATLLICEVRKTARKLVAYNPLKFLGGVTSGQAVRLARSVGRAWVC